MPLENCASNPFSVGNINSSVGSSNPPYYGSSGSVLLFPAAANLLLSSTAPTISVTQSPRFFPATANLVLSTTAPTISNSGGFSLSPATANLVLSTTAPTVARGDNQSLSPAASDLMLSTTAPSVAIATPETSWVQIDSQSASGSAVDFTSGLTSYGEFLVFLRAVTGSTTLVRQVQVSSDGGSTWKTASGDYKSYSTSGVRADQSEVSLASGGASAARDVAIYIACTRLSTAPKPMDERNRTDAVSFSYPGGDDIDGIRVKPSTGTFTGGTVVLYGR